MVFIDFREKNTPAHNAVTRSSLDALLIDFMNFIAKKEGVFPFTTKTKLNLLDNLFEEKTEELAPSEEPRIICLNKDNTIAKAAIWVPTMYLRYKKSEGIGYGIFLEQKWFNETDGSEEWRDVEGAW